MNERIAPVPTRLTRQRSRGGAMLYGLLMMPVFLAFGVLAVDVGRYFVAKSELQAAADAAARYAVAGMARSNAKGKTAYNQAVAALADERVEGQALEVDKKDVEIGYWNTATRTFDTTGSTQSANAVKVTVTATLGGPGSAPTFASAIGGKPRVLQASSIAMATAISFNFTAPSSGNLWLSGAADNTVTTNQQGSDWRYDSSGTASDPKQRPTGVSLSSLGVQPGDWISMDGLDGSGSNGPGENTYGPDGNLAWNVAQGNNAPVTVPTTSDNGISNLRAPISSFVAVFLSDDVPANTAAPTNLDFGTPTARDFASLSPELKQTFFIGDGKRANGEVQTFKVPPGATRVFFGMMDAWQWNDNTGSYTMSLYRATKVTTVK